MTFPARLTITSATGAAVAVTLDLCDTYVRAMGTVVLAGRERTGLITRADVAPAQSPLGRALAQRGLRHAATLGHGADAVTVALAEDQAALLNEALAAAERALEAARADAEDARWEAAARLCPAGHVPARIVWSNGDLMGAAAARDGVEVIVADTIEQHAGFVWVAAEAVEAKRAQVAAREEARAAEAAELRAVEVPAQALASVRRYGGDADRAWAAEDERAAMDIRRWGDAIEAQGLGSRPVPRPDTRDGVLDAAGEA